MIEIALVAIVLFIPAGIVQAVRHYKEKRIL